jgi:DNA-3-methyladenine glycosylase I
MVKAPPTSDARERCAWVTTAGLYERYHDEEWGVPTHDSDALFELIVLEGMQAGLSWLTILTKRRRFRERLFGFSAERLARANARDVESWMADPGLIRHRGKLEGVITGARATLELEAEGGLGPFLWSFVNGAPRVNRWKRSAEVPSETPESRAMSKALKARGFKFVGPTICYALMQSAGLVNDHLRTCFRHSECQRPGIVRCTVD